MHAPPDTPVIGLETGAEIYPVRGRNRDGDVLELGRATADLVIAGQALVAQAPGLSALVLESANLPPCRAALTRATGLPVHDILTLIAGIFLGVSAARQANRLPGRLVPVRALLLYATPPFWTGLMMIVMIAVQLGGTPTVGGKHHRQQHRAGPWTGWGAASALPAPTQACFYLAI